MLRNLKMYHQFGIGDTKTIEMSKFLNGVFVGLSVSIQDDGNVVYSRNKEWEILYDKQKGYCVIHIDKIWLLIRDKYNITNIETEDIIKYYMCVHYNISKCKYSWMSENLYYGMYKMYKYK